MGRTRVRRETPIQQARRIGRGLQKSEEQFRKSFVTGAEVDRMFALYHRRHMDPVMELLGYLALPWYRRVWMTVTDWWADFRGEEEDEAST